MIVQMASETAHAGDISLQFNPRCYLLLDQHVSDPPEPCDDAECPFHDREPLWVLDIAEVGPDDAQKADAALGLLRQSGALGGLIPVDAMEELGEAFLAKMSPQLQMVFTMEQAMWIAVAMSVELSESNATEYAAAMDHYKNLRAQAKAGEN